MSKVVTVHGHTLELDMGPSCPNPGIRRQLDAKGEPYMCTSDLTTWIGIDGDWYRIYKPSITLEWPGILELAETEDELLDYLEDVSEFTRNEKAGSGWQGMNNDYEWTSVTDDVFKDCVIPATTFDKGPLQFEIDEQLNTTWYKE